MIESLMFILGMLASGTLLALMLATGFIKDFRFWPPGERDWRWLSYWILSMTNVVSLAVLTIQNLGSVTIGLRTIFGGILALVGLVINIVAIFQLGMERTSGLEGEFYQNGLYSYSRNPQVAGNLVMLAGLVVALPVLEIRAVSVLTGLWLYFMVFAEEDWLEEEHGEDYLGYKEKVPRFF